MKKNRFRLRVITRWVASGFLLLFLNTVYAQQDVIPLKTILDSLETRHNIIFSYADEQVNNKSAVFPNQSFDLDESLSLLESNTGLSFEKLNDRYIVVRGNSINTICGYLHDKVSGEPIEFAIIMNTNSGESEISGIDGYFNLSLKSSQVSILITHISYSDTLLANFDAAHCHDIFLTPTISELEEVYVSNYLVKGLDKKTFGEYRINTKELQVLPGLSEPDVLHMMQVLPGIQSPLESVSDLNIRGGTNDQNLILWDGIRMFQSGHFFGLITAFNPYFTEEVNLVKNGSSAIYGEAISGILDIRSTEEVTSNFSGGGGVNWLSGDLHMDIPISPDASLSVGGRRSVADLIRTPTYRNYYTRVFSNSDVSLKASEQNEDFQFYDVSGKLNWEFDEKNKLSFSLIRIVNDITFGEEGIVNGEEVIKESRLTQQSLGLGMNYSRNWSQRLTSNLKAYFSSYRLHSLNNDITNNQRLIQENDVLDIGVQFDLESKINEQVRLASGVQIEETGIVNLEDINNPDFRRRVKNVLIRYVGYSELSVFANESKTNLRMGIRTAYFDQLEQLITEPRLSFRHEITPFISFELKGEYKNQTTSQIIDLQTDFLGVEKRRWVLANNSDIPVMKGRQASLGFHYLKNKLLINCEGYYKIGMGIITSGQAFQNQFELVRSKGNYRTYGSEFLLSKQFDKFSFWGSYSLAWNWFDFPMLDPGSFPNNLDVRNNISIGNRLMINQFEISSGVAWHSGVPYTSYDPVMPISDGDIQYLTPNGKRLSTYLRMDLSAKYCFKLGDRATGQVGLSLWNLSDYSNIIRLYYQVDAEGGITRSEQSGLKFTPNGMIRFNI